MSGFDEVKREFDLNFDAENYNAALGVAESFVVGALVAKQLGAVTENELREIFVWLDSSAEHIRYKVVSTDYPLFARTLALQLGLKTRTRVERF